MAFEPKQLIPIPVRITPRTGLFGQHFAVWLYAQNYPAATFIWNVCASKAAEILPEVNAIVESRMMSTKEDYNTAYNAIVLETGLFKLAEEKENQTIEISQPLHSTLSQKAQEQGVTIEEYLRGLIE